MWAAASDVTSEYGAPEGWLNDAVLDIVEKYYPRNRIQPKTRFAIEELCQEDESP